MVVAVAVVAGDTMRELRGDPAAAGGELAAPRGGSLGGSDGGGPVVMLRDVAVGSGSFDSVPEYLAGEMGEVTGVAAVERDGGGGRCEVERPELSILKGLGGGLDSSSPCEEEAYCCCCC